MYILTEADRKRFSRSMTNAMNAKRREGESQFRYEQRLWTYRLRAERTIEKGTVHCRRFKNGAAKTMVDRAAEGRFGQVAKNYALAYDRQEGRADHYIARQIMNHASPALRGVLKTMYTKPVHVYSDDGTEVASVRRRLRMSALRYP